MYTYPVIEMIYQLLGAKPTPFAMEYVSYGFMLDWCCEYEELMYERYGCKWIKPSD